MFVCWKCKSRKFCRTVLKLMRAIRNDLLKYLELFFIRFFMLVIGKNYIYKMKQLLLILCIILLSCREKQVSHTTTVGIIPYKGISTQKTAMIKKAITDYYGLKVKMLPERKLPELAFINIKSARYRADSLINTQRRTVPHRIDYILGLTESDISVTKRDEKGSIKKPVWRYNDFGIMGLAYCPGNSCIVSGFRLKHKDREIHFGRFKKVVIHELGHNFGLPHCPNKKCVMTDAVERIKTIDNAGPGLCIDCKKKLDI
jgi:archaemetzincin